MQCRACRRATEVTADPATASASGSGGRPDCTVAGVSSRKILGTEIQAANFQALRPPASVTADLAGTTATSIQISSSVYHQFTGTCSSRKVVDQFSVHQLNSTNTHSIEPEGQLPVIRTVPLPVPVVTVLYCISYFLFGFLLSSAGSGCHCTALRLTVVSAGRH